MHPVAYACNKIINEFDPEHKGFITKTHFMKLLSLLNHELLDKEIDIGIQSYWYMFGEVSIVDTDENPYINFITDDERSIVYPNLRDNTNEMIQHHYEEYAAINKIVYNLSKRFKMKQNSLTLLLRESYQNAPIDYQIYFLEFKILLEEKMKGNTTLYDRPERDELIDYLENFDISFNEEILLDLYPYHRTVVDAIRVILKHPKHGHVYEKIHGMIHAYWQLAAKKIRYLFNHNLSGSQIQFFKDDFSGFIETYKTPELNSILEFIEPEFQDVYREILDRFYGEKDHGFVNASDFLAGC